jgi:hypothetical protein
MTYRYDDGEDVVRRRELEALTKTLTEREVKEASAREQLLANLVDSTLVLIGFLTVLALLS